MSLFASLTTAITGLNAQQDAIGNISDNIANAQTIGFKGIGTSFQNLVTESTPQLNQPGGVKAQPVYQNNIAGNLTPSQVTTNLAISGNGFFQVLAPPTTNGAGSAPTFSNQDLYTQAGDFTLNAQGYMVNSAGYYLTGYNVNPQTGQVNTSTTSPIQISQLVDAPVPTSLVTLAANLPSSYPTTTTGTPPQPNAAYQSPPAVTEQIFDANGNAQTEQIQFDHTSATTWTAQISDGNTNDTVNVVLTFGTGTNAGQLVSIADASTPASANLSIPTAQGAGAPATFAITQNFGNGPQTINFNFGTYQTDSGVTQFADTAITVQTKDQNGVPRGSFENVSITSNGDVNINYTNGQTLTYYQIPVAQFNAPDQLQRLQGSAFRSTLDSGAAQLSVAGTNGSGTISPSTLEESNVDIATQFTQLITAQQVYSANSKVITTADQLLTTVINLIQG
jgi:flagellar hook protein FlgE